MKLNEIEMTVVPDFRMFVGLEPDPTPVASKVNRMYFKNHPFEKRMTEMVRIAKENEQFRAAEVKPKVIPSHITVKYNDEERGYGMFNSRLDCWIVEYGLDYPSTFRTEAAAKEWYRELI